jgi:hypothetical protein
MDIRSILRILNFGIDCSIRNYAIVLRHLLIFNFNFLCIIAWFSFVQFLLIPCSLRRLACSSYLLSFSVWNFLSLLLSDAFLFIIPDKLSIRQKIFLSVPFLLRSKKNVIVDKDLVRIVSKWNILMLLRMRIRVFIFKEIVSWVLGTLWALYVVTTNQPSLIVNRYVIKVNGRSAKVVLELLISEAVYCVCVIRVFCL